VQQRNSAYKPLRVLFLIILALTAVTVIAKLSAPKDKIPWRTDIAAATEESRREGKPALLYFTASWCPPCQRMAGETWGQTDVEAKLQAYVPVKIDIDKDRATAESYRIDGVPTFVVLDKEGNVTKRTTGFLGAQDFLIWINR
jgi:protein disulfide-isomerase